MLWIFVLISIGIICLYYGADWLIDGGSDLAIKLGVTPFVVGLTVVAAGTSMPEAVSSLVAQVKNPEGSIALGNMIGSNIANIGLILGLSALFRPVPIPNYLIRQEAAIMLLITVLVAGIMYQGLIGRYWGLFLFALSVAYVLYLYLSHPREEFQVEQNTHWGFLKDFRMLFQGILAIALGGYTLIEGSVLLAKLVGISDRVIGLTIVAVGTSLPELAVSVVAALKDKNEILVGNIIGSNVFNLLFVLGIVAMFYPVHFEPALLHYDMAILLGFSLGLLFLVRYLKSLGKFVGVGILGAYGFYISSLFY